MSHVHISSLPNDMFLNWTKIKAFADNEFNIAKIMISVFNWVENTVEKGEIAHN